jgi:hypothetical protein
MVAGMLPLTAVLLAGCGGGDDQAKVEASPQHYLVSLGPEAGPFPIGAGPPRVKENGCKDRHVKKKEVLTRNAGLIFAKALAVWACVVKVGTHIAMPDRRRGRQHRGRRGIPWPVAQGGQTEVGSAATPRT